MIIKSFKVFESDQVESDLEIIEDILENEELNFEIGEDLIDKNIGGIKSFLKNQYVKSIVIDIWKDENQNAPIFNELENLLDRKLNDYSINAKKFNERNLLMKRIKRLTGYSLFIGFIRGSGARLILTKEEQ